MPNNRKPRKKYIPRAVERPFLTSTEVNGMTSMLDDLALIVELKLCRGLINRKDIERIHQFFNWIGFSIAKRREIDPENYAEAVDIQRAGASAFGSLIERSNRQQQMNPGEPRRYIPSGDEMKAIQECVTYFLEPMKEALRTNTVSMVKEFQAMRLYISHNANKDHAKSEEYEFRKFS